MQLHSNLDTIYCNNPTGSLTVTTIGTTAPYTYHWNNNATNATINGLSAGIYTVTVTDTNGCTNVAITHIINQTSILQPNATLQNPTCGLLNGSIALAPSGGTAPYTYRWSNIRNTATNAPLAAGIYTATITDANTCSLAATYTLTAQTGLNISIIDTIAADCSNQFGRIAVTSSGGTAPYTYIWNNGNATANTANLSAATYTVTATDANGCSNIRSIILAQASKLLLTYTAQQPKCRATTHTENTERAYRRQRRLMAPMPQRCLSRRATGSSTPSKSIPMRKARCISFMPPLSASAILCLAPTKA